MKILKLSHYLLVPFILLSHCAFAGQNIDKQIEVANDLKLNVKVQRGKVTIKGWDKQSVSVIGTLDELSEGFILQQQDNTVLLEDKMPRQFSGKDKDGSSLIIMVPENLTLYAEGLSSNYEITSLEGDISINSVSGNIQATGISNQALIHTISGDIFTSKLNGHIKLDTVSGNINDKYSAGELSYKSVSGRLNANSSAKVVSIEQVSGNGTVNLQHIDNLEVRSISGDLAISLTSLGSKANLDSVSGDLMLELPQTLNASFDINGGPGGKIYNHFSEDKPTKDKYSPSSFLQFQSGKPTSEIKINTISGDIKLIKGN